MVKRVDDKYLLKSKIYEVISSNNWCNPEELKKFADACLLKLHMELPQMKPLSPLPKYYTSNLSREITRAEFIGNAVSSFVLYLDKEAANAYGIPWDGTHEDVERINKDLKGKTFILNKGLEQLVDAVR